MHGIRLELLSAISSFLSHKWKYVIDEKIQTPVDRQYINIVFERDRR